MQARQVPHYVVVCSVCRRDAMVCPRRQDGDIRLRAVRTFERAGWLQVTASSRRAPPISNATELGDGTWYCPTCRERLR
jgi:hypothetical protein